MFQLLKEIPKNIKIIGMVSFLLNTSTLMVYSIFGLYLHDKLGINFEKIGFLDGTIEGFSFIIKIFSGITSDIIMNRKIFIIIGTLFLFVAKPIEAVAISYWKLFSAKVMERLGNGLQATPRDAIVGDWAPEHLKGTSFGMRQMLAAFGSVIGSILAFILLKKTNENFQLIFWFASIPAFLAVLTVVLFVQEKKHTTPQEHKVKKIKLKDIKNLGPDYWLTMLIASIYMLSKVTESIIIIHIVKKLELPLHYGPICMIFYQLANSIISLPAGIISDKLKNRDNVILSGILIFILSDIIFIYSNNMFMMALGLMFFGGYVGISQSIFHAKIIDIVPGHMKGTGIGIFNFVCAISLIIGGYLSGYISDTFSTNIACMISTVMASIVIVVIVITKIIKKYIA